MKRGFLFGLGSFFILAIIAGVVQFISARDLISVIVALVLIPVSILIVRAATNAPKNRSTLYAVVGWLLGFFVLDAVILAAAGIVMAVR